MDKLTTKTPDTEALNAEALDTEALDTEAPKHKTIHHLKNILIVAPFVSLPGEPYFNRFLYLCYLWAKDYSVTLVTSSFCHPTKQQRDRNSDHFNNLPFQLVLIDEPGYRSNVSLARFGSHHAFHRAFKQWLVTTFERGDRFDVVHSAFPLISTNLTLGSLKKQYGYRLIVDVQDIWPDSIFSAVPFLKKADFLLSPLRNKAHQAYSYADGIVAVSKSYLAVATSRCPNTPSHVTYLGSDYQLIESVTAKPLPANKVRLVYLGTLSYSYDIETVALGFAQLTQQFDDIELHILGDGPNRAALEHTARSAIAPEASQHIFFHGFLPYEDMVAFVKSCDFAINPIVSSAAQSVTNKLSDYIALGLPILSSQKNWEAVELVKSQGGYGYEAGSPESFAAIAAQAIRDRHTAGRSGPKHSASKHSSSKHSSSERSSSEHLFESTQKQIKPLFDRRISYPRMTEFIENIFATQAP